MNGKKSPKAPIDVDPFSIVQCSASPEMPKMLAAQWSATD
jgi:hypothetical protein